MQKLSVWTFGPSLSESTYSLNTLSEAQLLNLDILGLLGFAEVAIPYPCYFGCRFLQLSLHLDQFEGCENAQKLSPAWTQG